MNRFKRRAAALLALIAALSAVMLPATAAEKENTEPAGALWEHFEQMEPEWVQDIAFYDKVPLYYQTDYPNTPYGHGTVSSSGCGITCLAMAATYLTDEEHLPDELAAEFGDLQMNNVQRINHAIEAMGLPLASMPTKWEQMAQALRNGQIVILLVNDKSIFTDGQHFLVLTGLTVDGKVKVHDPYEPNYYDLDLIDGLFNGFPESDLAEGFDGGWIFEKKEPAQKPDIPDLSQFSSPGG